MIKFVTASTVAVAISGLFSSSAPQDDAGYSAATLAALDPTRLGRLACRGNNATGAVLDTRLNMAEAFADQTMVAGATMPLYSEIEPSQLPSNHAEGTARRFFDQGVMLTYGFNHAAAIRAFREASRRAPDCIMCLWGIANASGPNINAPLTSDANNVPLAALAAADLRLDKASELEREMIAAQKMRYSADPDADRAAMDAAYSDAMMALAKKYPDNDDIAVLAVESAMTTTPWNYWSTDKSEAMPRIGEAVSLLERVIERRPDHPQAAHLYYMRWKTAVIRRKQRLLPTSWFAKHLPR